MHEGDVADAGQGQPAGVRPGRDVLLHLLRPRDDLLRLRRLDFTGRVITSTRRLATSRIGKPFGQSNIAGCFTALEFLSMLGLYIGALVVIYGIINFEPLSGIWPAEAPQCPRP